MAGFDLKKLLEDTVKTVNPFGLGTILKTAQTVQQAQRPTPASTAQPKITYTQRPDKGFDFKQGGQKSTIQDYFKQNNTNQADRFKLMNQFADAGDPVAVQARQTTPQYQKAVTDFQDPLRQLKEKANVAKILAETPIQLGKSLGDVGATAFAGIQGDQAKVQAGKQQALEDLRNTPFIRDALEPLGTALGSAIAGNQLLNRGDDPQAVTDAMNAVTQRSGISTDNSQADNALKIGTAGGNLALGATGVNGLGSEARTVGQVTTGLVNTAKPIVQDANRAIQSGANTVRDTIPTASKLTDAHPEILALKDQGEQLFNQRNALVNKGVDINAPAVKQIDNAIRNLGQEYSSTYQRVMNQSRNELQRGSIEIPFGKAPETPQDLPIVGTNLSKKAPVKAELPVEEVPTAKSTFANSTVQRSKEVSDPLKGQVESAEPTFQTVTDAQRIADSEKYIKTSGVKKATTDVRERLNTDNIDDKTVSDAIALVKELEKKPSDANLLESSAILEELSVKLSKAGQTVQAASLLNNRTPAGLQYGAIRTLKKAEVPITGQVTKDIGKLIDTIKVQKTGSYEDGLARFKLAEYVSKKVPSSNLSKGIQLWKAGLLTSPRTTTGNLAGNFAESVFNKAYVDPLANIVDTLFSVFTKNNSRSYTLRGLGSGTKEGIEKGISYFKTGYDPRNPAQKFDVRQIHYSDKPLGKAAEAYTQTVFKLMGVADQPFYYANLRNSLYDQAITGALNKGLKGAEKSAFIKKFVTEPEKKALQLADAEARYSVFQNETALGKAASRVKNMEGIPGDVADFVIPFSGVPSSIATRMIERTPIGTAIEIAKQVKSKKFDQRTLTKAIANGSSAIPLIGAGSALANAGMMTLGYPADKKERDLWEAEGKQPYSIKVGDQWLSLNYFQPAGNLMAAGAEYAGARKDGKTPEEAFSQSLAGSGKAFSEQSFLKGVSSIGNAIADPSRFGQTFSESTAGSLVPNIVRTGARAFDPVKREVDNVVDSVKAGIPGLRQTLDVKTDITGQDVKRNSSPINEILNPTKPSDIQNKDNPVVNELRRLQDVNEGIVPTEATKSSLPDLDTGQLRKVNKEVATQVSKEWDAILKDPRYTALDDSDKKRILDRVNDTVFGAVKSVLKPDTKLTEKQQQYLNGETVDFFDGFETPTSKADRKAKAEEKKKVATAKKASGKKSSGTKRDFSKLLEETNKTAQDNQGALRKLVYGSKITRKKIG